MQIKKLNIKIGDFSNKNFNFIESFICFGKEDKNMFEKEIVSRDWGALLMVWLDKSEVQSISGSQLFLI
jgi:hypothetical protein